MLECTINLVPKGFKDHTKNLASVRVINDGTGNLIYGNYRIEYETEHHPDTRTLYLKGFDRAKDAGELYKEVFDLIYGNGEE